MKRGFIIFSLVVIVLAVFLSACSNSSETPVQNERKYVSNSTEECSRIRYMCVKGMQAFSDETGCGCEPQETVCTEDAKVCPDGTSVGRDPENNCEFFACPDQAPVANTFWCKGQTYDLYDKGFCATAIFPTGTSCLITEVGDVVVPQTKEDTVQNCVDEVEERANAFSCRGDYYNLSKPGTCATSTFPTGTLCLVTEFGDLIVKDSLKDQAQKCIMTCGNAGPSLNLIDETGVHSCTCSIEGMSCDGVSKDIPINNLQDLSLGGQCQTDADCMTGGCSGQLCGLKEVVSDTVTTCEYRNDYACLKETSCGCNDGICQWANTPEYQQCLEGLQ